MEHTNSHDTHHTEDTHHQDHGGHGDSHNDKPKEELRLSGDDIISFFRKLFKAGNSRSLVWKNEDNEKVLSLNLILVIVLCFFIPVLALISILILVIMNHSLTIEKKKTS